jgi:hypothetical protein
MRAEIVPATLSLCTPLSSLEVRRLSSSALMNQTAKVFSADTKKADFRESQLKTGELKYHYRSYEKVGLLHVSVVPLSGKSLP